MEPLGNLNKGFTVRTTRGLPFNVPCEYTSMHKDSNRLFLPSLFHNPYQEHELSRRWPLLGLPTLPTAGERSKEGKKRVTSEASVYARLCML